MPFTVFTISSLIVHILFSLTPSQLYFLIVPNGDTHFSFCARMHDCPCVIARSALGTVEFLLNAPLVGFALGISLRAGKFMGARDAQSAIQSTRAAFIVVGVYAAFTILLIGSGHSLIAPIFTSDPETSDLITRWSPILCGVFFFDSMQFTAGGTLRGIGRPVVGAVSSMISYLCIGIPASYLLGVTAGWGVPGIWVGVGASVFTAFCIMGGTLARIDWVERAGVVADAAEREAAAQLQLSAEKAQL